MHLLEAGTLPAGQASEPFALGISGISSPREKSVHGVWGEGLQRSGSFLSFTCHFVFSISGDTESGWDDTAVANDSSMSSGTESSPQSPLTPDGKRSPKGIKKFWGK